MNVSLSIASSEVRNPMGLPTGQWEPEKRYTVTLQPVVDGTNGLIVWGASRDGCVKIVTTSGEFQQGKIYTFESTE